MNEVRTETDVVTGYRELTESDKVILKTIVDLIMLMLTKGANKS